MLTASESAVKIKFISYFFLCQRLHRSVVVLDGCKSQLWYIYMFVV
jgi:hypothetical protein